MVNLENKSIQIARQKLTTQSSDSNPPTDGALTLENPEIIAPDAEVAHLWKLGKKFILDVVMKNGEVRTTTL